MAHSSNFICRKFSLAIVFMLLLQSAIAQYNFNKIDAWLNDNLKELGGRAVLVIYKDGKVIYNNDANKLSTKQKFIGKRIAKKKGKDLDIILQDFNSSTQQLIASCSKWLSAALVMTFVDEDKLNL